MGRKIDRHCGGVNTGRPEFLLLSLCTQKPTGVQVWDADGSDSFISTKDSLGDNDFDEFGLGDLTVRPNHLIKQ